MLHCNHFSPIYRNFNLHFTLFYNVVLLLYLIVIAWKCNVQFWWKSVFSSKVLKIIWLTAFDYQMSLSQDQFELQMPFLNGHFLWMISNWKITICLDSPCRTNLHLPTVKSSRQKSYHIYKNNALVIPLFRIRNVLFAKWWCPHLRRKANNFVKV